MAEYRLELISIGAGSVLSAQRLLAVVGPDSAPIRRLIQEARDRGILIDATAGHKTRSVFIMDSDHVILSARKLDEVLAELA